MSRADVASIVADLKSANEELSDLLRDEPSVQRVGAPSGNRGQSGLVTAFARYQRAVPPSVVELAAIVDGWEHFSGELHLLSAKDRGSNWVAESASLCGEFLGGGTPFSKMVPLALMKQSVQMMVFVDPSQCSEDGECEVVRFDSLEEEDRFPSCVAYIQWELDVTLRAIDFQRNGDPG